LILIDIDDFKDVNDSLGHLSGDKILIRVAQILKNQHRKSDIVARWGGEEFALLLVDTPKEDAVKIAENLRVSIREDGEIITTLDRPLTISLGLGELLNKESQDGLIQKVDKALYDAKGEGKDRLVIV
jgi:diguanylate cyclase (GGDEF)-like protein